MPCHVIAHEHNNKSEQICGNCQVRPSDSFEAERCSTTSEGEY